ncbi:MAG: NADH-quinone oxidoreductase subunit M [Thalassobaculales bacterium]
MTATWPLLSLVTFLPLVGAAFIFCIRGDEAIVARNARGVALWTSLITFVLSLLIWLNFDAASPDYQMVEKAAWMPEFGIGYHMGVDGISLFFVLLSTFLTPLCVLASWEAVTERVKEYMIAFLVLETMMVGMFCALDFVLFYVFFEAVLIPMFLIIGVWGGPRRVYAAFKFFLYTLLGSVLMLLAILYMYLEVGVTDIPTITAHRFAAEAQTWLWLALFASFAVKVPMWPVHTWLPDAHVEAPTAGSVILAGVLLKMGAYGFLRFSLPMLPEASVMFQPLVFTLSVVAVIYTSLVALAQEDMKKLIAYSSVAHMGFVTLGIFTFNKQGLEGAVYQMLSHGIVSGALFLCVGVVYDRLHTREIARYGGLVHNMPRYALVFMVFTLATVGLPGTGGFVGEFLALTGAFQVNTWVAALAATGVILGAAYSLWLYRRVVFGVLEKADLKALPDLSLREVAVFAPLVVMTLWMGIYPSSFLKPIGTSVDALLKAHAERLAELPPPPALRLAEVVR